MMTTWKTHYINAVEIITDTEFRADAWGQLLVYIGQAIGASAGTIAVRSRSSLELVDPVAATWPGNALTDYFSTQCERDPIIVELTRKMCHAPDNSAFSLRELLDQRAYQRSRFFNDFADHYDLPYLAGTSFGLDDALWGTLFFHRPGGMREFSRDERTFLQSLSPIVRFALRMRRQARELAAARGMIDCTTMGVILLDERGCISHCNQRARDLIARSERLTIARDRVISTDCELTGRIEQLCARALRGRAPLLGGELCIPDIGKSFIHLIVLPVARERSLSLWGDYFPAAMIVNHSWDGSESMFDAQAILRDGYGCSPTQARVGALFARGLDRKHIAENLGMSVSTVKTHLDAVRVKTGAADKVELATLLHRHLLPIGEPPEQD